MRHTPRAPEFEQVKGARRCSNGCTRADVDRIAHPGLRAEMDDPVERRRPQRAVECRVIGEIRPQHREAATLALGRLRLDRRNPALPSG